MTARLVAGLILVGFVRASAAEDPSAPDKAAFFESTVRPILQDRCVDCHGGGKVKGGLDLASRAGLLEGGERGPAIAEGEPSESLLLEAINHQDLKMPPRGSCPRARLTR